MELVLASLVTKKDVWYAVFTKQYRQQWVHIENLVKQQLEKLFEKLSRNILKKNLV